jgi:hypothetical protein
MFHGLGFRVQGTGFIVDETGLRLIHGVKGLDRA